MRRAERDLLLRSLGDELEPEEKKRLEEMMERDPALASRARALRGIESAIREAELGGFERGFAERLWQRFRAWPARPAITLPVVLRRQFFRLAPAAVALMLLIGAYNLLGSDGPSGQTTLEATFGLQPVTLEAAYAFDPTLYGAGR